MTTIYEISNSRNDIMSRALMNYLGFTNTTIYTFFKRNDIMKKYINIKIGLAGWNGANSQYFLNSKGDEVMSLINHFKNYFCKLK
jgi:hypothetical protein